MARYAVEGVAGAENEDVGGKTGAENGVVVPAVVVVVGIVWPS